MPDLPFYVLTTLNKLENNGFEAYIAGGCVRDFLMNKQPHDFDITTNALPEHIKQIFSNYKIIKSGEKHGTIAVIIEKNIIEITTYRIDGSYFDNRHPEKVIFSSDLSEDLKRRDFTVNAMVQNKNGEIIDLFGGKNDIENKIIRTVGNAYDRFQEDALRIMRCLRFASTLGFDIESETSEAAHKCAFLLKNISVERIKEEFIKILCGNYCEKILRNYCDIIEVFIPEIRDMYGFDQHTPYHKFDVWEHTLHAVSSSENSPLIRTVMFFHDIAKPDCFTLDKNGVGHFKNHALLGAEKTKKILKRMRFSSKEINEIIKIIANHRYTFKCKTDVKRMLNKIGEESFFNLIKAKRADDNSKGIIDKNTQSNLNFAENIAQRIIEDNECYRMCDMKINGNDLLELGFKGKQIGEILDILLEKIICGEVENERDKLINCTNLIK